MTQNSSKLIWNRKLTFIWNYTTYVDYISMENYSVAAELYKLAICSCLAYCGLSQIMPQRTGNVKILG